MQEGLHLVLTGSTLVAILTLGVKFWQASKAQQVGPQPFRVTAEDRLVSAAVCDDARRSNSFDHSNIFARLSEHDKAIAALQEAARSTDKKLDRIENKIDGINAKL
jgi:hypothetical protein